MAVLLPPLLSLERLICGNCLIPSFVWVKLSVAPGLVEMLVFVFICCRKRDIWKWLLTFPLHCHTPSLRVYAFLMLAGGAYDSTNIH